MTPYKAEYYMEFGKYLKILLDIGIDEVVRANDQLNFRAKGKEIAFVNSQCGWIDNEYVDKKLKKKRKKKCLD